MIFAGKAIKENFIWFQSGILIKNDPKKTKPRGFPRAALIT